MKNKQPHDWCAESRAILEAAFFEEIDQCSAVKAVAVIELSKRLQLRLEQNHVNAHKQEQKTKNRR
jgi:hypothetical protein